MRETVLLRVAALVLAVPLGLVGADVALAQEPVAPYRLEMRLGVLAHDVPDLWSGFRLERGVDLNGEILFGSGLAFLGGRLRPAIGGSVNTAGYTSKAYLDARWQRECENNIFYAFGIGIAVHDGETMNPDPDYKQLGRRVLFHDSIEIGYRLDQHNSLSLYFEHISNASTAPKNQGLDALGIRYGYRF